MTTPVLSISKQKRALSAKKKNLKKVTIKNILVSPYTNYWPVLKEEDCVSLNKVLAENLIIIKPPKTKIPWKELKEIPREDRRSFRSKYNEDSSREVSSDKLIAFGINEVTKLLENDAAASILLASDVHPQLMVKHITDEAVLKNVPLLVVPNLKTLLKEKTGISSLAFAIKKCSPESNYSKIIKKVQELSLKYPVPHNHINSLNRSEPFTEPKLLQNNLIESEIMCESESEEEENLHLSRTSKGRRVFEPQKPKPSKKRLLDFIEFEAVTPIKKLVKSKPQPKQSYKSLLIKRVTNNPNRSKNKKL